MKTFGLLLKQYKLLGLDSIILLYWCPTANLILAQWKPRLSINVKSWNKAIPEEFVTALRQGAETTGF